jgi:hypothetical protein
VFTLDIPPKLFTTDIVKMVYSEGSYNTWANLTEEVVQWCVLNLNNHILSIEPIIIQGECTCDDLERNPFTKNRSIVTIMLHARLTFRSSKDEEMFRTKWL